MDIVESFQCTIYLQNNLVILDLTVQVNQNISILYKKLSYNLIVLIFVYFQFNKDVT